MTSPTRRPFLLHLLLALALAPAPLAAAQGQGPTPVQVDRVRREPLQERRRVTGDVRAARRARIASEEEGRVLELLADEGARVERGAVLARLDATRLELDLAVLTAQEAVARAASTERRRALEQEERDLASVRRLVESRAANEKELADAETAFAGAQARLAQADAELAVLGARAALLRERLSDMEVRAPFDGVVVALETEVGQWLAVGGGVVEMVSDEVEAWLEVPQRHFAALGTHAGPIALSVAGGAEIAAPDWRVIPVVDPAVRTATVIAPLADAAGVAPGMSVEAWVPVAERAELLTVRADAVLSSDVGSYVLVAAPGAEPETFQARPAPVEVLWRIGARAVVRSDALEPGARAIVEGHQRLPPGTPVAPSDVRNGDARNGDAGAEPPQGPPQDAQDGAQGSEGAQGGESGAQGTAGGSEEGGR